MKIQDEANKYHTTRAINNSMLKQYIDNPFMAGLRYWSDVKLPEVSKEAFKQGDALHAKVLEPERFNEEYTSWWSRQPDLAIEHSMLISRRQTRVSFFKTR